jgi:Secretion system C-terminal sorting domain
MKRIISNLKVFACLSAFCFFSSFAICQTAEWRLLFVNFNGTDPDGGGPALASAQFKLQVHAQSGSFSAFSISTGFSYQSSKIVLPITCTGVPPFPNNPTNIVLSSTFITAGYSYNVVNECLAVTETTGGQTFDRRVNGTLENGSIVLSTTWVDVFTVTLWTKGITVPEGGYVMINSGEGGTPGQYTTYAISDAIGNSIPTNSLTYTVPLPLGSTQSPLPVVFTRFDASCVDKGTLISWKTATELNSNHFEVEKSTNSVDWVKIGSVPSSLNSSIQKSYQYLDLESGQSFYRLAQVDADGKRTYTSIIRSSCEGKQFTVALYPIPAKDKLHLVIRSDRIMHTEFQVFDVNGKIVKRIPTTVNIGNNNFEIAIQNLAAGEYILRSSNPTIDINKKFVIAR